jgi:hypothetical protein
MARCLSLRWRLQVSAGVLGRAYQRKIRSPERHLAEKWITSAKADDLPEIFSYVKGLCL